MIGSLDPSRRKVNVIGGGASGLFAAFYLQKGGYDVSVYESSGRFGGMLASVTSDHGVAELAANSLVWTAELQSLCDEIGVRLEDLAADAQGKFLLRANKLRRFPLTFLEFFALLLRMLFVRSNGGAINCRQFADAHLGRAAADYLMEPMVTGIYGARASDLSLKLCFPALDIPKGKTFAWHLLTRKKQTGGKRRVVAPFGGMQVLVDALVLYLRGRNVALHLNTKGSYDPQCNTILCTNAMQAGNLLQPVNQGVADLLSRVSYTPMISVSVFVEKKSMDLVPKGLGVLIPETEGGAILGVLFSSSSFPSRVKNSSGVLLTVMLGGQRRPELLSATDQALDDLLARELGAIFGSELRIASRVINRWPQAIPCYSVVHADILKNLRQKLSQEKGLILFGSYAGEVSLRGMLTSASQLSR